MNVGDASTDTIQQRGRRRCRRGRGRFTSPWPHTGRSRDALEMRKTSRSQGQRGRVDGKRATRRSSEEITRAVRFRGVITGPRGPRGNCSSRTADGDVACSRRFRSDHRSLTHITHDSAAGSQLYRIRSLPKDVARRPESGSCRNEDFGGKDLPAARREAAFVASSLSVTGQGTPRASASAPPRSDDDGLRRRRRMRRSLASLDRSAIGRSYAR